jgi:hypothetical protein
MACRLIEYRGFSPESPTWFAILPLPPHIFFRFSRLLCNACQHFKTKFIHPAKKLHEAREYGGNREANTLVSLGRERSLAVDSQHLSLLECPGILT